MRKITAIIGVILAFCMIAETAEAANPGILCNNEKISSISEQNQEIPKNKLNVLQHSNEIKLPGKNLSPDEVLLLYFEALYFACNLPEDNQVPISGTIGMFKEPYPVAYACWSKDWRQKTSYEEFLASWENTVNVELLKLVPAGEKNGQKKFFIETKNMEAIQDSKKPRMGIFYYKGYFTVDNTDEGWRITEADLVPEDPSWYIAGHQSWLAIPEDVAKVVGIGVEIDSDTLGPGIVEHNADGSITVRFQDKKGNDIYKVVLVQTEDYICQVISTEKVSTK